MQLRPALEWLSDEFALGPDLSRNLRAIYAARPPDGKQFYISLVRSIGNPNFLHELGYTQMKPGDSGFQILAAFRFWNIIEYWFPYRDVLGENWDAVLEEAIPKIALAKTRRSYEQELMMLIARAHDTHANLWSSLGERPPTGPCSVPVSLRFIENEAVVSSYLSAEAEHSSELKPGDIASELDGIPISTLVERWAPYYAASNEPTRLRDVVTSLTRGECGDVAIRVRRDNAELSLKGQRVPNSGLDLSTIGAHDLAGETFRRLSDDVAYIKIRSPKFASISRPPKTQKA